MEQSTYGGEVDVQSSFRRENTPKLGNPSLVFQLPDDAAITFRIGNLRLSQLIYDYLFQKCDAIIRANQFSTEVMVPFYLS